MLNALQIERTGVPIYVQIREQVLRAIGAGILAPGEQMPTMRQVAVALRVDLNTVRRAYESLAATGAITLLPARGTFVASHPPPARSPDNAARIEDLALRTIAAARTSGIAPAAIARRILTIAKQQGSDT